MLRRLLLVLLALLVLVIIGVVGFAAADALAQDSSADVTNVTYPADDGVMIGGYLALPPGAESAAGLPAVIMVHEWWGLNAEIVELADLLAAEGYVVLAPDTYRGNVATTIPGALLLRVTASVDRVNLDMRAATLYLLNELQVDPARVGIMGFCYGGGVALRYATINSTFSGVINLYGDTITNLADFGLLSTTHNPILGIFGEEDQQIPVDDVLAFNEALGNAQIPHEVTIYPNVGHAFVNPTNLESVPEAQQAWAQILAFLETNIKRDVTEDANADA